jgi:hypothetical protein
MIWSKIVAVLKRLDSRLSDAVYLHRCHLTARKDNPPSSSLQRRRSFRTFKCLWYPCPRSMRIAGRNRSIANSVGQSAP